MAQIKKIVRSNPISQFRQVAPDGGATFRVLADGLNDLYDRTAPVAVEQMEREGKELGRQRARQDFGNGSVSGGGGDDRLQGGNYRDAIASIESRGSGDYQAIGPTHPKLGRALGRYQIMEANIGPWSKAALGREVSADEFLSKGEIQDQIFDHRFGGYVAKYGERGAAQAWFAGPGGVGKEERKDVLGTTVGGYGDRFVAALRGGKGDEALAGGETGVSIRARDGSVQLRRFSPYAGPILQAHDAAARVAYQAETINQASIALNDIGNQYEYDPEGYTEAAQAYIDEVVKGAAPEVAGDLRDVLSDAARKTSLGIMDAKHTETRARANNSSRALMERWSGEYAEAIASGDPSEIDAAQRRLDNVLQAREALPGVAWTPEQSANVFLKAEDTAQALIKRRRDARNSEVKDTLNLITDAAKAGRQAEGEEILSDPAAVAAHPELAREAKAFVALRDNTPGFLQMTPDQQAQEIARIMEGPVGEKWEIDVADAAAKMAKENRKAWADDPVKRASEVLETPPPPLPDLTPEDPGKFVDALSARREYMNRLRAAGYTDTNSFLSEEEANQLGVLMGKGTDPAIVAAMSGAIVAGFGQDAVRVFDEIGGDRVTMFAGKMQALGGRPEVAQAILQGQQMIAENMVQLPPKSDSITAFDGQVATAFQGISGGIEAQAELMEAAKALYASQAQGIDPTSDAASDLMKQSIQTVLGQSKNKRGEVTGGVQAVMGHQTLLPVGVAGKKVDSALRLALGGSPTDGSFGGGMALLGAALFGGLPEESNASALWLASAARSGPLNSGTTTQDGRPIWYHNGETYSEKTITEQGPDGRFYNVPTVGEGGTILGDDAALEAAFGSGQAIDPITRKGLPSYGSIEEAVTAAEQRTADMPAVDFRPRINGQPIPSRYVDNDMVRPVSIGGNLYRLEVTNGAAKLDVEDGNGNVLIFDLQKFMEASE
ncbi:hypothetical protein VWY34_14155 [Phaeobacter sp. JH20_02]|uniref:hypothetical protein n=1 Tax=unclassified Phaeobacter TaxID=2621772 RepID=UPI003A8ABF20